MRLLHVVWLLLALFLPAAEVFAQAGSGSSGFGGGGGGGGGGFSGGGGGGFSGGGGSSSGEGSLLAVLIVFGLFALFFAWAGFMILRTRARRRRRIQQVVRASAAAAEDDPAFAADAVVGAARELFLDAQRAWDRRDRTRLGELIGADLLAEWELRLDDFERKGWHNRVRVVDGPEVEYVGLTNRATDDEDRVVLRIKALMDTYVSTSDGGRLERNGSSSGHSQIVEYWTLAKRGDGWILTSIEPGAEGDHHLSAPIVVTPWSDDERLYGESVTELAVADARPGFAPSELVDVDLTDDARAQALDLSVADGRFAPAVLEAAARRAVAAWAEAVDGADAPLEAVATPEAVRALLYGHDDTRRSRLVVRGPRVQRIAIAGLDAAADPPAMTLEVEVSGRRYVENRDTLALLEGSRETETAFTERWTLTLSGPPDAPWQLSAAAGAARAR